MTTTPTISAPPPTLHKSIPMGARVVLPEHYLGLKQGKLREGEVVGVASCHVIYFYIVLLDVPVESPYGVLKAMSVPGTELVGTDGNDWKNDA